MKIKIISGVGIAIALLLIYLWRNRLPMKDILLSEEETRELLENYQKMNIK